MGCYPEHRPRLIQKHTHLITDREAKAGGMFVCSLCQIQQCAQSLGDRAWQRRHLLLQQPDTPPAEQMSDLIDESVDAVNDLRHRGIVLILGRAWPLERWDLRRRWLTIRQASRQRCRNQIRQLPINFSHRKLVIQGVTLY